jgi:hypothetical protein
MDHAGRWNESETVDLRGRQHSAQLELEVIIGLIILVSCSQIPDEAGRKSTSPDLSRAHR